MSQTQQGDGDAYRELLNDIGPDVARFVRTHLRNAQDVDDVYQDVLLALHRARRSYQSPRPVEPWLFAIARHVVGRHLGRQRALRRTEVVGEPVPDRATPSVGHLRLRFAEALRSLPPHYVHAIQLLKLEGLSTETAAARLGTTPGAMRVRAHRAYRALRVFLLS